MKDNRGIIAIIVCKCKCHKPLADALNRVKVERHAVKEYENGFSYYRVGFWHKYF